MFFKNCIRLFSCVCLINVIGCTESEKKSGSLELTIENQLSFDREEVVSIPIEDLDGILKNTSPDNLRIKHADSTSYLPTQWVDIDLDGSPDEFLFMAKIAAKNVNTYILVADSTIAKPESKLTTYSRFVPERTDDYTWENDKIAFRTYGPTGQKEALAGVPGSTLSSGIDLWLKRTSRSVINDWYKGYQTDPMYYHRDKGEGYDPYHVGGSRGVGGIGIYENDSLIVSQNFMHYKTIAEGPLRTVFELSYDPWSPYEVQETKRISLDLGANFSKFEISLKAAKEVPNYTVGLTMHKNEGQSKIDVEDGWVRYWEKIDDAYVGEGIVMPTKEIDSAFTIVSEVPDASQIYIKAKPTEKLVYYAGFAWQKSGQVKTVEDWELILDQKAKSIASPLEVTFK
ncbi:protein of unknown function [Pustulibacterium marinum]|uniref:DUF4861 domain-containing protein n=1 Tax=Pustulibacterium marinum TaxID=1224947 RepID=A0A1I7H656_9FLAO|nr:DUF4861 family protein [Pustulibacterium marinum]SFU56180.1 protein of unknown function [Pustulibacterium marinum]